MSRRDSPTAGRPASSRSRAWGWGDGPRSRRGSSTRRTGSWPRLNGSGEPALGLVSMRAGPLTPARDTTRWGTVLTRGVITGYLSLIVLIPLAAVVGRSREEGAGAFWSAITQTQAVAALRF